MRTVVLIAVASSLAVAAAGAAPVALSGLWANHDTGLVLLSVTSVGGIGYVDVNSIGNGMKYPKTGPALLYHGAVLVGNDTNYIVDRFFNTEGAADPDFATVESLQRVSSYNLQEYSCLMSDAGHPSPKGLQLSQYTVAAPDSGYKDFVLFFYEVRNPGSEPVNGLYIGIWCDFDIATANANFGGTDTVRRAVWMSPNQSAQYPTVGIQILSPDGFSNLALVDHEIYVYPDSGVSEGIKYRFLNGTYGLRQSNREYDWSAVAAWGPFDLPAGGSQRIDFALLGGINRADFLMNCDSAAALRTRLLGIAENQRTPAPAIQRIFPNPFRTGTRIALGPGLRGPVEVSIYDAAGNLVRTLWTGKTAPTSMLNWDGCNNAGQLQHNGVYLLHVRSAESSHTAKLTLAR